MILLILFLLSGIFGEAISVFVSPGFVSINIPLVLGLCVLILFPQETNKVAWYLLAAGFVRDTLSFFPLGSSSLALFLAILFAIRILKYLPQGAVWKGVLASFAGAFAWGIFELGITLFFQKEFFASPRSLLVTHIELLFFETVATTIFVVVILGAFSVIKKLRDPHEVYFRTI